MDDNSQRIEKLLKEATQLRGEGKFKEAKRQLLKILNLLEISPDARLLSNCLNELARTERELGNTELSLERYNELAVLCEEKQNIPGKAHALRHIADIKRELGQFEQAGELYTKTLALYKKKPASRLALANTFRGYALLLGDTNRKKEALKFWEKARSIYEEFDVALGIEECEQWIVKLGRQV